MPKKTTPKPEPELEPIITFETFTHIGPWRIRDWESPHPSCFNGNVSIRKYKVTIETVDEPVDVLAARLQKLWEESDNFHHVGPLKMEAAKIGYELQGRHGSLVKK